MEFGFSATPVILVCAQLITAVGCAFVKGALPSRRHSRACSGIQRNKGKHLDMPTTHRGAKGAVPLLVVLTMKVIPLVLWIPVTPVITADGCNDWGDENDEFSENDGVWAQLCLLTNSLTLVLASSEAKFFPS